ncbi:hypothetical protein [Bacillus sp. FJAT-45037]|uniref:hypothetical protein n=1 Tax=Bacillus sp. FJAT-45037 TaxID=2011007 RepID=UPI000C250E40|nr:hypothetical protein [Bacillus sp. FJAT-45037]
MSSSHRNCSCYETLLLFRTPPGAEVITTGVTNLTTDLPKGSIYVAPYSTLRVIITNRRASLAPVTFSLIIQQDNELILPLDTITLEPGESLTKVYPIPGTRIRIDARINESNAESAVDVLVYGRE